MYVPAHFAVNEIEQLLAFVAMHPLATLVVHDTSGLAADHIPLLYLPEQPNCPACFVGHIAKANPLCPKAENGIECLAVFHGAQRYISPNWYATKKDHGRAVPTWNYEAVHVSGKLNVINDRQRLRQILELLTLRHETSQSSPWTMSDAPEEYIEGLFRSIVGIELSINSMLGKSKLSQNQPDENRRSIVESLNESNDSQDKKMAKAIDQRKTWVEKI
ncbi:MAG: FMN-binding negative transcriptional regulator [Pirellulales bacterium]